MKLGSFLFAILICCSVHAETMPERFVYLRDVDASIRQAMLYAGARNFTGRRVAGYDAAECVLVREAADALKAVQAELKLRGLCLIVYDCYRPVRAVQAFVAWAKEPDDPEAKRVYYPGLVKGALFPDYIATVSAHSRGATVDVALVPADPAADAKSAAAIGCGATPSGSAIDMGTGFDCFDPTANTFAPGLTPEQVQNRNFLLEVMQRNGFRNYEKEWWHYTLRDEPFPDTTFDFPILPRRNPKP